MTCTTPNLAQLISRTLELAERRFGTPVRGSRFGVLLRELDPGFDERNLGYPNLREFLAAYPDVVEITHDGLDIVPIRATHASAEQLRCARGVTPNSGPSMPILRPDIWRAFTLIDPNVSRYFDRQEQTSYVVSSVAVDGEPAQVAEIRQRISMDPARYVTIPPIDPGEQLEEMKKFAAELQTDDHARKRLASALEMPLYFREFMAVLRTIPGIELQWKARWANYVLQKVQGWMEAEHLQVANLYETRVPRLRPTPAVPATARVNQASAAPCSLEPLASGAVDEVRVRRRVIRAIQRMPMSALLALPIPLEYILEE